MGHGGTLDPLATGVLIVGIGRGTKSLQDFLACKKTYETVVLFGKSTDTYDVMGKVLAEASTDNITQDVVEDRLTQFQGKMKQIPPIYSAIKIDGMKLYEYARSGKELPRNLESRDIEVSQCTLLDFYKPGEHEFRWPAEQGTDEEKAVAQKLMAGAESTKKSLVKEENLTRSRSPAKERRQEFAASNELPPKMKAALHTHDMLTLESTPANAPAAAIRLTVSSGFYVRSFAHDLGIACDSYGTMASLVRSQQGEFSILDPAPEGCVSTLTYEDLEAGENVWGPKIGKILEKWMDTHPPPPPVNEFRPKTDDRDRPRKDYNYSPRKFTHGRGWRGNSSQYNFQTDRGSSNPGKRRNSSSPEG